MEISVAKVLNVRPDESSFALSSNIWITFHAIHGLDHDSEVQWPPDDRVEAQLRLR